MYYKAYQNLHLFPLYPFCLRQTDVAFSGLWTLCYYRDFYMVINIPPFMFYVQQIQQMRSACSALPIPQYATIAFVCPHFVSRSARGATSNLFIVTAFSAISQCNGFCNVIGRQSHFQSYFHSVMSSAMWLVDSLIFSLIFTVLCHLQCDWPTVSFSQSNVTCSINGIKYLFSRRTSTTI
jgi:hypothetical protein